MKFYQKTFISFVLILVLGICPAAVLAEENNDSTPVVSDIESGALVETREMRPGDIVPDPGWPDEVYQNNSINTSAAFSPRLTAPNADNVYYFA